MADERGVPAPSPLSKEAVGLCYQCSKCVGICPVASRKPVFNPRKIVLSYLEDDYEPLVHNNDSPIWLCAVCFSCDEFCPQDVKPHEAITYLRNLAVAKGKSPDRIRAVVEAVNKSGVSTQVARSLKARREALGLADFTEPGALPSCLFEG